MQPAQDQPLALTAVRPLCSTNGKEEEANAGEGGGAGAPLSGGGYLNEFWGQRSFRRRGHHRSASRRIAAFI